MLGNNQHLKTGHTIKMVYDFPTHRHLQVKINNKWYRVTASDFRSFAGERRIDEQEYQGPIYYKGTNTLYEGEMIHKPVELVS